MPDHIHLLLSIPAKQSISSFMGYLKGKSSMMIFKDHGNLRYKFGNSNFWATGYYVITSGLERSESQHRLVLAMLKALLGQVQTTRFTRGYDFFCINSCYINIFFGIYDIMLQKEGLRNDR